MPINFYLLSIQHFVRSWHVISWPVKLAVLFLFIGLVSGCQYLQWIQPKQTHLSNHHQDYQQLTVHKDKQFHVVVVKQQQAESVKSKQKQFASGLAKMQQQPSSATYFKQLNKLAQQSRSQLAQLTWQQPVDQGRIIIWPFQAQLVGSFIYVKATLNSWLQQFPNLHINTFVIKKGENKQIIMDIDAQLLRQVELQK